MGADPFLTAAVDIENYFLNPSHLSLINSETEEEIADIVEQATDETMTTSIEKYVNGRTDIEKKAGTFGSLNIGELAASASEVVQSDVERYRHSKSVLKAARRLYQDEHKSNLITMEVTPELAVPELENLAEKL